MYRYADYERPYVEQTTFRSKSSAESHECPLSCVCIIVGVTNTDPCTLLEIGPAIKGCTILPHS